jgi:uncharacterized coiled-coil protein SlyX
MNESEILARLTSIETALAHQQKALDELSEVAINQGKLIDSLVRQNAWLKEALLEQDIVKPLSEETPPPHY